MVSANGGEPKPITVIDSTRNEGSHRWPFFLPDGKHFLYLVRTVSETGEAEGDAIFVGSLDGAVKKMIVRSSTNAMFANGYLIFVLGKNVMAQKFDADNLTLSGEPFLLDYDVINDISWNLAMYSVSTNGILLMQKGVFSSGAPVEIYSREGKLVKTLGGANEQQDPRFSPDGNKLLVWLYDNKTRKSNLWIYDKHTGGKTRLTNSKFGEFRPVWSPDGTKILYWSLNKRGIFEVFTNRTSEGTAIFSTSDNLQTQDWSSDGKVVLVRKTNVGLKNSDILWFDYDKRDRLVPVINSPFDEADARLAPDGKWVSYLSNETGEYELYVTSFDKSNGQTWKVSENGAFSPRWGASSNELYYLDKGGSVLQVKLSQSREGFLLSSRKKLFAAPGTVNDMDISRDGRYFAFTRALEGGQLPPISMNVYWYNISKTYTKE